MLACPQLIVGYSILQVLQSIESCNWSALLRPVVALINNASPQLGHAMRVNKLSSPTIEESSGAQSAVAVSCALRLRRAGFALTAKDLYGYTIGSNAI